MKKVLFTATVDSHINHFHLPYLKLFKDKGYEVHVATNTDEPIEYCDVKHKVTFERSPFKTNNLKAIKQLKKILDKEKFDIIHTHTPMGSVVTRIAAIKTRKENNTRVIYTAHGFHFYKGAPIINWLLFYPVERILSKYTDTLITINNEDYELAKKRFTKTKVEYVPGVGVDENKFNFEMIDEEKIKLREEVGCNKDSFILIFPAELSKRKNQGMLIKAMKELVKENNNIHLLLPGKDSMNGKYQVLTKKMNLENNVHFLGYRKDIPKLMKISDLAVSSSKQEGLPVNIIEAMICGLPIVVTNCRGNRDLVNDENELVIKVDDVQDTINKIREFNKNVKYITSEKSKDIIKEYFLKNTLEIMTKIYDISNIDKIYNKNLISVIIPTYNCEKYLEKCINSILNQTYQKFEIIICDDCSTDNTYNLAVILSENDKRIKVIKNSKNLKAAYTRNNCISLAQGEYIAIQDADDYSDLKRFEECIKILDESSNIMYVSTGMNKFDEDGVWASQSMRNQFPNKYDFLRGLPYIHASTIFRRVALDSVNGYVVSELTNRMEDFDLFFRLNENEIHGMNINKFLYFYNEDNEAYKRRKYKYRIDEAKLRFYHYRKLNLIPIGLIFVLKPLIIGLIPRKIQYILKKHIIRNSK